MGVLADTLSYSKGLRYDTQTLISVVIKCCFVCIQTISSAPIICSVETGCSERFLVKILGKY